MSLLHYAVEEHTRDGVPMHRAMTKTNLGNAVQMLGAREGGRARLQEATAACRAALEQ